MKWHALKHLARLRYGAALATETRDEDGGVPVYGSGGAHGRHGIANTSGPVVIVGRKGSVGALHWSDEPVWVADTAYAIDQLLRAGDLRFVYYFLAQSSLGDLSQDVGVPGLSRDAVHSLSCPAWSIERQAQIAGFLDRACEQIDAAAKHPVGNHAEALLQASLEEHFEPGREDGVQFRRLALLHRGYDLPSDERVEAEVPVIGSSGPIGWHDRAVVRGPAVVTGRYGTIGQVTYVDRQCWPLNTTLFVHDFKDNDPRYVYWALRSLPLKSEAAKSAVPGLHREDAHRLTLRIHDESSRAAVVAELNNVQRSVDLLRERYEHLLRSLGQYRDSLIHEAVTGKLDVTRASEAQMDERLHAARENRLDEVVA